MMSQMPNEEEELPQLKKIYDELWVDARSMIKDMSWSLDIYLISSIFIFCFGIATIFVAIAILMIPQAMAVIWLSPFIFILTFICGVCQIGFSVILLYWYSKLKSRYNRVIQQELTLGD